MELTTFERLILLNILPKEGDFTALKIMREMKEDLSFDEKEQKALQFQFAENGGVKWKTEADKPKEIKFGEKATDIVVDVLKKLNDEKKLKEEHLSLYEKFIGG